MNNTHTQTIKSGLIPFVNQKIIVYARIVRFGTIGKNDSSQISILLKNPYTYFNNKWVHLASQAWIRCPEYKGDLPLQHGDKISFKAEVCQYNKIGGVDYGFRDVSSLKLRYKNESPVRIGIFTMSITVPDHIMGYDNIKGNKTLLIQSPIEGISAPYKLELELKDIRNNHSDLLFRFRYKFSEEKEWRRYAYFVPRNGQKMTLCINNRNQTILLDTSSYFKLKDMAFTLNNTSTFPLPLKEKHIKKLKKAESEKVDLSPLFY